MRTGAVRSRIFGNNGESPVQPACSRGLDGLVQRQEISLVRDILE